MKDTSLDDKLLRFIDTRKDEELRYYDQYNITDLAHYNQLQKTWLDVERYYLGQEKDRHVTDEELITDALQRKTFNRFRAFYILSYPQNVTHRKDE